jgi:hypothetical protein
MNTFDAPKTRNAKSKSATSDANGHTNGNGKTQTPGL